MIGKSRWLIGFLLIMFLAGACTGNKVYDRYVHTPVAGWEKNDTLVFCLSPMAKAGQYEADLGLRITTDYPFMGLTLIVDQMICPSNVHHVRLEEHTSELQSRQYLVCRLLLEK